MTEAYRDFCTKNKIGYSYMTYDGLVAFVNEVKSEEHPEAGLSMQPEETGNCFNKLVREFGLDGKKI